MLHICAAHIRLIFILWLHICILVMHTNNESARIGALLYPPLAAAVEKLRARGYSDSEIIRRGVRLVAAEEGIAIEATP